MTGDQPGLAPVAMNLLGIAEHPAVHGDGPYRVSQDGTPYVPVGDGGIVLGLQLGDSAFALDADHAAPGACLVHPDPAARLALATYACVGNPAEVRTGGAAGARGAVIGKRGEAGRVIVTFSQDDLARLRPGDEVKIRAWGQGWRPPGLPEAVAIMNVDPDALAVLPVGLPAAAANGAGGAAGGEAVVTVGVRAELPGKVAGNGLGRPAAGWDLDLQLRRSGLDGDILLGDLVALTAIDARSNIGYRRGWVTVGVVVHGGSPLPGHGPGITPILTGPASALRTVPDGDGHVGLTAAGLKLQ
jgi:hypothetical protein